jgi:hypothetical protein
MWQGKGEHHSQTLWKSPATNSPVLIKFSSGQVGWVILLSYAHPAAAAAVGRVSGEVS